MAEVQLKVGQVWKDNDPRVERFVRILRIRPEFSTVLIRGCYDTGEFRHGSPETLTRIARFGEKGSKGFTIVRDAP